MKKKRKKKTTNQESSSEEDDDEIMEDYSRNKKKNANFAQGADSVDFSGPIEEMEKLEKEK